MAEALPIVAQRTMDQFFQSYKSSSQFFDLEDFIFYTGATIADIYRQEAQQKYAELRALKQDEVVTFPADWLLEQRLKIVRKDNETYGELSRPVMSFSWDNQVIGVQDVLPVKPIDAILERTTQDAAYQCRHVPYTNRIFWYVKRNKILFQNKGGCNVSEVSVLYIPALNDSVLVPDAIIDIAINQTVLKMKQVAQGTIEKKGIDGQQKNITIETEMNKLALKQ
jgi:hypothetical protein